MAGCATRSCIDVCDPVRVRRLKEWAESDAKFLRKLSMIKEIHQENSALLSAASSSSNISISVEISDSLDYRLASRQRFLRSYKFGVGEEKQKHNTGFLHIIKILTKKKKKRKGNNNQAKAKANTNNSEECSGSRYLWKDCVKFLLSCAAKVDVHSEESISITRKSN